MQASRYFNMSRTKASRYRKDGFTVMWGKLKFGYDGRALLRNRALTMSHPIYVIYGGSVA